MTNSTSLLDFEKPLAELQTEIEELRELCEPGALDKPTAPDDESDGEGLAAKLKALEVRYNDELARLYSQLGAWEKTAVARHPDRPHLSDYIEALIESFYPLSGDRAFADDKAVIGGLGRFRGRSVVVIGQEKGHDMQTRVEHNFGMARPEGYRKAIRLMRLAEHYKLPVLTFVDTAGAYPGVGAEERGQAEAIARAIECCLSLKTPLVSMVIGEGGSGGAIAIAAANRIFMLEHAIYSVISPEGCASILWRDGKMAKEAAQALRLTSDDLLQHGIIDDIVEEPLGGAHRDPRSAIEAAGAQIESALEELSVLSPKRLRTQRQEKFIKMTRLSHAA